MSIATYRSALAVAVLVALAAAAPVAAAAEQADHVLVRKSERTLYLMRGERVLRSFKVALGLNPNGHKEREGDFRTPEGRYRLTTRNADSDFFLSILVDYPNAADIARARRRGERPGGAIMIHGQPNQPTRSREYYRRMDWTNGCIAVTNAEMVDIWLMTPPGIPIDILP